MADREPIPVDPIRSGSEKPSVPAPEDLSQLSAQYGDGRLLKMEVDYAPQVDEALPKADQLAKVKGMGVAQRRSSRVLGIVRRQSVFNRMDQ